LNLLKCVEKLDYLEKRPVALIRIFDPDAARSAEIRDFASLDQHPELILYEWHRETQGGEIEIFPLNKQSGEGRIKPSYREPWAGLTVQTPTHLALRYLCLYVSEFLYLFEFTVILMAF
jgi:hypothetical protein